MENEEAIFELEQMMKELIVDVNLFSNDGDVNNINPTAYAYARIVHYLGVDFPEDQSDYSVPFSYMQHDIVKNLNVELPNELRLVDGWQEYVDVFARDLVDYVIVDAWNSFNEIDYLTGRDVEVAFLSYLKTMFFGIKKVSSGEV